MNRTLVSFSHLVAPRDRGDDGSICEAREALVYWSQRAETLPWHRRAARREARELATRWRARLVAAHLQRWRLGRLQLAVMPLLDRGGRSTAARTRRLVWSSARRTTVGRAFVMAAVTAAAITAACVTVTLLAVAHFVFG